MSTLVSGATRVAVYVNGEKRIDYAIRSPDGNVQVVVEEK